MSSLVLVVLTSGLRTVFLVGVGITNNITFIFHSDHNPNPNPFDPKQFINYMSFWTQQNEKFLPKNSMFLGRGPRGPKSNFTEKKLKNSMFLAQVDFYRKILCFWAGDPSRILPKKCFWAGDPSRILPKKN